MSVEDWEARRILDELQRHHAGAVYEWDTFTAKLERLLADHIGRRTVESRMVRAVAELAYGHVAEQLAVPATERDAKVQQLVGVIERMEKRAESQGTIIASLNTRLDEKRTIREERAAAAQDGDTDVTISNDYRGWTVAMLEEIAYRLRSGGAVDDTPVEVDAHRAKATVPAPNLVTLHAPAPAPTIKVDRPLNDYALVEAEDQPWSVPRLVALAAVLAGVMVMVGAVIW